MTPLLAPGARAADRAFERLYQRHAGNVYHYALAVLRNRADAEDVTQTTFLNAYRAFQRGERPQKPHNWLITIAHNVCRQRFRQAARRPNEVAFDEDVAEAMPLDSDVPTADDLSRALGHLAFNQRSALVMRELEGRSYAEIARALDITVSAVETLLFRARRALREQLEGSLTCNEAELAISRQLDGRLPRSERGALRAHLRECEECATFARSQRAQRSAWKGIAAIPLPSSLASFIGGGGGAAIGGGTAAAGFGLGAKATAMLAAAALAGGVGYEGVRHAPWHATKTKAAKASAPAPASSPASSPPASPPPAPVEPAERSSGKPSRAEGKKAEKPALAPGREKEKKKAEAAPASPAPAVPEPVEQRAKAVGLARSEHAARDKTKPIHRAVGLARSEERSKAKSNGGAPVKKEKKKQAPATPPPASSGAGNGSGGAGGNGQKKKDAPAAAQRQAPQPPAPTDPTEHQPGKGNGK